MKLFYVKRCNWLVGDRKFYDYDSAYYFMLGFNSSKTSKSDYVFVTQEESVKLFAYSYDKDDQSLKITQTVWRYSGEPQYHSYWTNQLRKSHIVTVSSRFENDDKCVFSYVPLEEWESSVFNNREKFVQYKFYKAFEKSN